MHGAKLCAGLSGARHNACVALSTGNQMLGICGQERITRVRSAGFNTSGLPDEALDELLRRSAHQRGDIAIYAGTESVPATAGSDGIRLEHHFAHACSAFLTSPHDAATILICDHEAPQISVWDGQRGELTRLDYSWNGVGFAELYSSCAEVFGFTDGGKEQRLEALARLNSGHRDDRIAELFAIDGDRFRLASNWRGRVEDCLSGRPIADKARIAAALQSRIADLLLEFITQVRGRTPERTRLCVGGSLFFNSYFNSRVKLADEHTEVFVPINPGNGGLSVASALYASRNPRQSVTPFLGPAYSPEEIKATLDNCKLTYQWASDTEVTAMVVDALKAGRLVAWFDGAMEWGPRALGARSILASPFAPYTLDNLNRFLKQREPWRGYALSGLDSTVGQHFDGPRTSPFMECDYLPKDRGLFREILPGPNAAVRVHTVGAGASPRFEALLQAFGAATGVSAIVNTSFNGFLEPIVCSPRDAVRVFFGSGVDLLALGQFVLSK